MPAASNSNKGIVSQMSVLPKKMGRRILTINSPKTGVANKTARKQKIDEFRERFANPFVAAERGFIDDVIEPHETRPRVIRALKMLATKVDTMPRKKHGNIPL